MGMETKRYFILCGGEIITPRGPYTGTMIGHEIAVIFGKDWHWSPENCGGSYQALDNKTGTVLAEAVRYRGTGIGGRDLKQETSDLVKENEK
jgi:hypothetical protein